MIKHKNKLENRSNSWRSNFKSIYIICPGMDALNEDQAACQVSIQKKKERNSQISPTTGGHSSLFP
jgi:hypothetical protein